MSLMELDQLSPPGLIAQFILAKRGQGLSLSRNDHEHILRWLSGCHDPDYLLCILDDLLPQVEPGKRPLPLKVFDRQVMSRLMHRQVQKDRVQEHVYSS